MLRFFVCLTICVYTCLIYTKCVVHRARICLVRGPSSQHLDRNHQSQILTYLGHSLPSKRNISLFDDGSSSYIPFKPVEESTGLGVIHHVDCSRGHTSVKRVGVIPYDEIKLAIYQGSESLRQALDCLNEHVDAKCFEIQQLHVSRVHATDELDSARNKHNAYRSIKCLLYWVTNRIVNAGKHARVRAETHNNLPLEQALEERQKCHAVVRQFVDTKLAYWSGLLNPKEVEPLVVNYPEWKDGGNSVEDYVAKLWTFFNARAFSNLLPDFWELEYCWFKALDQPKSTSVEMFEFINVDHMALPTIAISSELQSYPNALASTIFRAMSKLYCDFYASDLDSVNHCKGVVDAFRFVESTQGINFSVAQRPLAELLNGNDRNLLAYVNAYKDNVDPDIDNQNLLNINIDALPFMQHSFSPRRLQYTNEEMREKILYLYDESLKSEKGNLQKSDGSHQSLPLHNIWRRDSGGNIIIPLSELTRALLSGALDNFGTILSVGMTELLRLKPLQLNHMQNSLAYACQVFINSLRSLEAYECHYSMLPDESDENITPKTNATVMELNNILLQAVLVVLKLADKILTHNSYPPLTNSFLRVRPLAVLVDASLGNSAGTNVQGVDVPSGAIPAMEKMQKQLPVPFPQEYFNDPVRADDPLALRYLVNYLNFNLFGGRLAIDMQIEYFKDPNTKVMSSNDSSRSIIKTPTIYIHPLVKDSKLLVVRAIIDECTKMYQEWCNRFKTLMQEPAQGFSLASILESQINKRIRHHVANCVEQAEGWPLHVDNLFHISDGPPHAFLSKIVIDPTSTLNDAFSQVLDMGVDDAVGFMESLVARRDIADTWENKRLPIRSFIGALESGNYNLAYAVIANPASVNATSKLEINELNILENKFKEVCQIAYVQDCMASDFPDTRAQLLLLESYKIVECAFDELRQQAMIHRLISTPDLTLGITRATNDMLVMNHGIDATEPPIECKVTPLEAASNPSVLEPPLVKAFQEDANFSDTPREALCESERNDLASVLYRSSNNVIFTNALPMDIEIEFRDNQKQLSGLLYDPCSMELPSIWLSSVIDNDELLHLQLLVQMVKLRYLCTAHNVEFDVRRLFNFNFTSVFKAAHVGTNRLHRMKLLPLKREARLKDGTCHDPFIKELKKASHVADNTKNRPLLDMEVDELVDEILTGRKQLGMPSNQSPKEEYQTLKAFATHFCNWKMAKLSYNSSLMFGSPSNREQFHLDNVEIFQAVWTREQFDKVLKELERRKMAIAALSDGDAEWQSYLNDEQQASVYKYVALNADRNDNIYTVLVNSGAAPPKEAMGIVSKIVEAKKATLKTNDENNINNNNAFQTAPGKPKYKDSVAYPTKVDVEKYDGSTESSARDENHAFADDLQRILMDMDAESADVCNTLMDMFMTKRFNEAQGVIGCCKNPGLVVSRLSRLIDVVHRRGLVDQSTHEEIAGFLHNIQKA